METNQPGNSSRNPQNNQTTGTQATTGKQSGQFSDNLGRTLGHRGKFWEDLNDVSTALGVSLFLSGGVNVLVVLIALIIAVRFPESAPYLVGGSTVFDLPSLWHYFISTFPLMFGTAVFCILLFAKKLGFDLIAVLLFIIIFFGAMWLGGALGVSNFDIGAIFASNKGGWAGLFVAIIGVFYHAYGPYRFFMSILTGTVIAWSIAIKMFPYFKK